MKRKIIILILTFIFVGIYYYLCLPPINLSSPAFYVFLCLILGFYGLLDFASSTTDWDHIDIRLHSKVNVKFNTMILIPLIFVVIMLINFVFCPLFASKSYANRITIDETGNFNEDIEEVDFSKVPLLDKSSSEKLGDRVMGEMRDLVSQYYVSDIYTQINYKNDIIRVTPLEYAGLIKYFANHKEGIKGYITVNSVDGSSNLVKLDKGMKYVPSAIFNEDMMRHLRFNFPTKVFGNYSFEIDDEGNPFFIVPTFKYSAVGLRREVEGIVVLDPITGNSQYYDTNDVPSWIDHVYEPNLIIEQTDDWGNYRGGFWNSVFAQKNVVNTTDGYNYLAMNDDIYLYTGITSIQNDESNLGFILSNMRTKETVFYSVPGAEEYSAMASAEGQVQEMKYTSTFPLLISLQGRPTYLVSLKDDAGLVKKYAFIDVVDYQKVSVSDVSLGIEKSAQSYLKNFRMENNTNIKETSITINSIKLAMIDGNTVYYILDENKNKYSANISVAESILPFLNNSDKIKITYNDGDLRIIKSIEVE